MTIELWEPSTSGKPFTGGEKTNGVRNPGGGHEVTEKIPLSIEQEPAPLGRTHAKRWPLFKPHECPACEYDRQFPETASGGWTYSGNNGPYWACYLCNPDGEHPRS